MSYEKQTWKDLPDETTPITAERLNHIEDGIGNLDAMTTNNAGFHNSIYRGKDITDLFYDGTLSTEISAGTFDDIFIGDYIIGKVSGRKYLVADIDYYLGTGNTECTTHHLVIVPEKTMGTAQMNASNTTSGGYIGSAMYKTNLSTYKTVIQNDFGTSHILTHNNNFSNAVTNGYESAGTWVNSAVDLMSETMVYGCNIYHNILNGTNIPQNYITEKSQLALFRLKHSLTTVCDDSNVLVAWWLRSVVSANDFSVITSVGGCNHYDATDSIGVRPYFLLY